MPNQPRERANELSWVDDTLRADRAHFAQLVAAVQDYAIFLLDPEGRVATWNMGAERIMGYQAEEIIGQHFSRFYPKEAMERGWPDHELEMAAETGRFEDEGWRLREDGARLWANVVITAWKDAAGNLLGFLKITRDLTERRRAEEALRLSEERFRQLVSGVKDYAIYLLDLEGRVVSWNAGAERIKGYRPEEIIGQHFSRFYPEEAISKDWPQHELEVARADGRFEDEGWRVRKDGSRFWASVIITALTDEAGTLKGFSKITRDLTERKRAEEKLQAFALRLERSNRELEQFASVAAHDLQEPLRKIQAFGDRLKTKCGASLSEDGQDYLERMLHAAIRMRTLINDLLTFSRLTTKAQPFVPVNLAAVAREVVSDLEDRIQQTGAQVHLAELPTIDADPLQIRQLLQNLLGNALKFHRSDAVPLLRIDGKLLDRPGPDGPGRVEDSAVCQLLVQDNGIGFEEQYLDRIFDVFQRLHGRQEYEGTGMGLAICRKIVDRHGGSITARSAPGEGSTFIVTLPVHQPKVESVS